MNYRAFWTFVAISSGLTFVYGAIEGAFYDNSFDSCPAVGEGIVAFGLNSKGIGLSQAIISHFPEPMQDSIRDNLQIPVPTGNSRYIEAAMTAEEHSGGIKSTLASGADDAMEIAARYSKKTLPALLRKGIKAAFAILPMYYTGNIGFSAAHKFRCG